MIDGRELKCGNFLIDPESNEIRRVVGVAYPVLKYCPWDRTNPEDFESMPKDVAMVFHRNMEMGPMRDSFAMSKGLNPIPITRTVLEACGFKQYGGIRGLLCKDIWYLGDFDFFYTQKLHCLYLQTMNRDGDYEDFGDVKVEYLHQLQNLYYALFGKDMGIDEDKLYNAIQHD